MRALLDLCHPADVHFFRAVATKVEEKGHKVIFTARDKDVVLPLCREFGLEFQRVGGHHNSLGGKAWDLVRRSMGLARLARKQRVGVLAGFANPYVVVAGWLSRRPSLVLTDSENQGLANRIALKATATLTPDWFGPLEGERHRQAPWFKELAYIEKPVESKELEPGYVLVRRVAWGATHDRHQQGLEGLETLAEALEGQRIYVVTEGEAVGSPLPPGVESLPLSPGNLHSALAGAAVVISEGATTAAEAALLGRPTIYVNSQRPGYLGKLEEAGALSMADSGTEAAAVVKGWLESSPLEGPGLEALKERCCDVAAETARLITELAG